MCLPLGRLAKAQRGQPTCLGCTATEQRVREQTSGLGPGHPAELGGGSRCWALLGFYSDLGISWGAGAGADLGKRRKSRNERREKKGKESPRPKQESKISRRHHGCGAGSTALRAPGREPAPGGAPAFSPQPGMVPASRGASFLSEGGWEGVRQHPCLDAYPLRRIPGSPNAT